MLIGMISIGSCATTIPPEILIIRRHEQYAKLDIEEKKLAEKIMSKAVRNDRKKYYFEKLKLLLDTPTASRSVIGEAQKKEIKKSIQESKEERQAAVSERKTSVEEYMTQEEFYESAKSDRHWRGYSPEGWDQTYFYVVDDDPLDLLVHIRVRLLGDIEDIERILQLEDSIEKHLYIEGFSVNLVFVGCSDDNDDVFDVNVDSSKWPTSHNWTGGYQGLAHELMHLMGLPDEYDRIENHANNKFLPIKRRLELFLEQMDEEVPADAYKGIMCNHFRKPLERHVCAAVGLGEACIKARMKAFHSKE